MKRVVLGLIRLYQKTLSPFWPSTCRYYPSCSHYAHESVAAFGPWKGGWLALRRIGRCQPWGRSYGYDPVPTSEPVSSHSGSQKPHRVQSAK